MKQPDKAAADEAAFDKAAANDATFVKTDSETRPARPGQTEKQKRGAIAEQAVARHLIAQGYYLRQSNFSVARLGEIDLILQRGRTIYFVEVKARKDASAFGGALAAITARKRLRLQRAALYYLQNQKILNSDVAMLAAQVSLTADGQVGAINIVPIEMF